MDLKFMDQRRCTERVCRALAIIALPWPLPSRACLLKARRSFRTPNVFVNRIRASKQRLKNLPTRNGCRSARQSSVHSLPCRHRSSFVRHELHMGSYSSQHRVIAIDGPAASGKSSVARKLAQQLGFIYVNSGAIYRAITWHLLQNRIRPEEGERIDEALNSAGFACVVLEGEARIVVDDVDPTEHLRDDRVNES